MVVKTLSIDCALYLNVNLLFPRATAGMCPTKDDGNYVDCEQFCWMISSTARQCDCAIGFVLSTNGSCDIRELMSLPCIYFELAVHSIANAISSILIYYSNSVRQPNSGIKNRKH